MYEAEQVVLLTPHHTPNPERLAQELAKYSGCEAVVRAYRPGAGWVDYPLWPGDRAYVMNANRKTVDQYESKAAAI